MSYWNGNGFEVSKMSTVRESLAEYFRYLWLVKQQQETLLAKMDEELAKPYAVIPSFPYAGVKFFLNEAEAIEKFANVFARSLVNWTEAYELLIS